MITQIRPNRLEVSDRFPLLSFTVNNDGGPRVAEIVLATDPSLFANAEGRTSRNFFSSRELGLLSLPAGPAVYTVPPQVLARMADASRLWFGLATADAATGSKWEVDVTPNEASPYISLNGLSNRSLGRVRMFPTRTRNNNASGAQPAAARMEWAGDTARPGISPVAAPDGSRTPAAAPAAPAPNGAAARNGTASAGDVPYDDGFGPLPAMNEDAEVPTGQPANGNGNGHATGGDQKPGLVSAEALQVAQNYRVSDQRVPVSTPGARALSILERAALEAVMAVAAGPFLPVLIAARAAAAPLGLSVAVGIAGSGGAEIGGSIGGGVIFAPNGDIGLYGLTEVDFGLIFSASVTAQFTIIHGGISAFNGSATVATISGGEGIVGGLTAIFDNNDNFLGITIEAGVGIGEPVSVYVGIQNSVSTTVVTSQSLADSIDPEEMGIEGPAMEVGTPATASALGLTVKEYDRVSRVMPSPAMTTGRRGTAIDRIVIHITDAPTTSSTVNWFTRANANSSSHYLVGQDGEIVQFVSEGNTAWHARGSNSRSIGIEHVAVKAGGATYGSTHYPELHPSDIQYSESSALVVHLCDKYGLTPDRTTIIGHREADSGTSHTSCPDGSWDWDHFMNLVTNRMSMPRPVPSNSGAQALGGDIPLDPGVGGMSIDTSALEVGDIIVSTTTQGVSRAIRAVSGAEVSHAMLYVDQGGQVIEAVGEGVIMRPLSAALAHSNLAVAFRVPGLSATERQQVADAAAHYLDLPYNYIGIVRYGKFRMDSQVCDLLPGGAAERCRQFYGWLNLGPGTTDSFFCSQLVLQSYADAGHQLTTQAAHWATPGDIANLQMKEGAINYVGHLKAPIPQRSFFGISLSADDASAGALGNTSSTINWDDVQLIAQPTGKSCWSTTAAMLIGWRDRMSVTPEYIAEICGKNINQGLSPSEQDNFALTHNLTSLYNQSYLPEAFRDMLEANGPIFVIAGDTSTGIHAILVTGMYNSGDQYYVRVTDPWDRVVGQPGAPGGHLPTHSTGSRYIMTWEDFQSYYERTASHDFMQIMHTGGTHGHTPNLGEQSPPEGYAMAAGSPPAPTARGELVADNPFGPPTVLSRQRIDKNGRSYDLAQLRGLVMPSSPLMGGDGVPVAGERVLLDDWPYIDGPTGKTQAGIAVDWAHSSGAVGDVAITPLDGQTLDGWSVAVRADMLPDESGAEIAHIKVQVTTTFTKDGEEAQIAVTVVTLGGDGRSQIRHGADQAPLDVPPEIKTEPITLPTADPVQPMPVSPGNGAAPQPALEHA